MSADTLQPGLLAITGSDSTRLLQGQLTCDVNLAPGENCWGAHCTPQGRVISLFQLHYTETGFYLQMPATLVPIALAGLKKYAVFFKVTLADVSDHWPADFPRPALDWHAQLITQNIPSLLPETSEKFFTHELRLTALNMISFTKGCYTGQEIIARMHYRGKPKHLLYRAHCRTSTDLQRGQAIYTAQGADATLVDYDASRLLIVAPIARIASQFFIDKNNTIVIDTLQEIP